MLHPVTYYKHPGHELHIPIKNLINEYLYSTLPDSEDLKGSIRLIEQGDETNDIHRLDEGVLWAFPDWGPLAEDSAAKVKRTQLLVCTMYSFPPLLLKSVPDWPAIIVSS